MINGTVELWDLPGDKIYLILKEDVKKQILYSAKEYAGSWANLAKVFGLHVNKYNTCKTLESSRNKKISLGLLQKVIKYLESCGEVLNRTALEKEILAVAPKRCSSRPKANCLFNPKLPFDFTSKSGTTVISSLLHDGGIDSRLHPHYSNQDITLRKKIYSSFQDVFGDFDFTRSIPENNVQLYFPKIIGIIIVYGIGMRYGRKVTNNPGIPKFIFDVPQQSRAAFLRQAFDDEAHVHSTGRSISLKLASVNTGPPKLLVDLKRLLKGFNIKSYGPRFCEHYKDKCGTKATKWRIDIFHQTNLQKFSDLIGFEMHHKQARLEEIVNTLKQRHFAKGEKHGILLKSCRKIEQCWGTLLLPN